MIIVKISFLYNGKNYNGWNNKKNSNNTSIRYHFKKAFKKIFNNNKIKFKISSRTDKFVSAKEQTVSSYLKIEKKNKKLKTLLNNNLPRDIIIKKIKKINKEFDAKKNAVYKKYQYKIFNYKFKKKKKTLKLKKKININYFNELSKYILGENNFTNLKSKKCSFLTSMRKIIKIKLKIKKNKIKLIIIGNAFCYKMIRIITGFLIQKSINKKKNNKLAVSASFLCLKKVFFINNIKSPLKIKNLYVPKFPLNNLLF